MRCWSEASSALVKGSLLLLQAVSHFGLKGMPVISPGIPRLYAG